MPPIHLVYLFCVSLGLYFHINFIVILALGLELISLYALVTRTIRKEVFLTPTDVLLNILHRIGLIGLALYVNYNVIVPVIFGVTILSLIYHTIVMVLSHPFEIIKNDNSEY
jgi:hypothetical protein